MEGGCVGMVYADTVSMLFRVVFVHGWDGDLKVEFGRVVDTPPDFA